MEKDKTEIMYFKQDGTISTINVKPLKLLDLFTYFGSIISSTERLNSAFLRKGNLGILKAYLLLI